MAWRQIGDKPLSEPTVADSLTQICGTRRRWVNPFQTQNISGKNIFAHFIKFQPWNGTDSWHSSSYKTLIRLSYAVNSIAVDDLATQGAMASAAMVVS